MMEVYIAAGGLAIVILSSAVTITWRLSRVEIGLRADYTEKIATLRADYTRDIAALQAKVYQVEIWARDEFVRKGSFETVVARLEKGMEQLGSKVESAVDKMASRIENLNHHDR
jgi:hypothetical protein